MNVFTIEKQVSQPPFINIQSDSLSIDFSKTPVSIKVFVNDVLYYQNTSIKHIFENNQPHSLSMRIYFDKPVFKVKVELIPFEDVKIDLNKILVLTQL